LLKKYVILGYHIKDRPFDTGKLFLRYPQTNASRRCTVCELWSRDRSLCSKFLMNSIRLINDKLLPFTSGISAITICTKYKFKSFCYIPAKDVIKKL